MSRYVHVWAKFKRYHCDQANACACLGRPHLEQAGVHKGAKVGCEGTLQCETCWKAPKHGEPRGKMGVCK